MWLFKIFGELVFTLQCLCLRKQVHVITLRSNTHTHHKRHGYTKVLQIYGHPFFAATILDNRSCDFVMGEKVHLIYHSGAAIYLIANGDHMVERVPYLDISKGSRDKK